MNHKARWVVSLTAIMQFLVVAAIILWATNCPAQNATSASQTNSPQLSKNDLIEKVSAATNAKDWKQVEELCQQLVALEPANWSFLGGLANAQLQQGKYDDAAKAYDKAVTLALAEKSDTPLTPEKTKARNAAIGKMLTSQGNAYLKLKKIDDAVRSYNRAADLDPNPGLAYFNLCATLYNTGDVDGALSACDKAIAADPTRADAYFIKGSLLVAGAKTSEDGRVVPLPGTVETLQKYLALAPDGPHAKDVKDMLLYVGADVPATQNTK